MWGSIRPSPLRVAETLAVLVSASFSAYFLTQGESVLAMGALLLATSLVISKLARLRPGDGEVVPFDESVARLGKTLGCVFFVSIAFSLMSAHSAPASAGRPWHFFLTIFLGAFALGLDIFLCGTGKTKTSLLLGEVIFLSLALQWSAYFSFPSVIGIDPWWHLMFTTKIETQGYIPAGENYSWLPVMHLLVAATGKTLNLSYKEASYVAVGVASAILIPLVTYILTRRFVGVKGGLIAALTSLAAPQLVGFEIGLTPNTLAMTFSGLALVLVLQASHQKKLGRLSLLLVLAWTVVLTHAVVSAILLVSLACTWAIPRFARSSYLRRAPSPSLGLVVLLGIEMLGWWSLASGQIVDVATAIRWGFRLDLITGFDAAGWGVYVSQVPSLEQLTSNFPLLCFVALAIAGWFQLLERESFGGTQVVVATTGVALAATGFGALVLRLWLIWDRWLCFAQLLLTLPISVFLMSLNRNAMMIRRIILSCFTSALVILAVLSPQVNNDFAVLTPHTVARHALTESEMATAEFAQQHWPGIVYSDAYFAELRFSGVLGDRLVPADSSIREMDFSNLRGGGLVTRVYWEGNPVPGIPGVYFIRYDYRSVLQADGWSQIYSSGSSGLWIQA